MILSNAVLKNILNVIQTTYSFELFGPMSRRPCIFVASAHAQLATMLKLNADVWMITAGRAGRSWGSDRRLLARMSKWGVFLGFM